MAWLADQLQALFVLTIPLLATWRVFHRERSEAWSRMLVNCTWLAIIGSGLELITWLASTMAAHLHHARWFWLWIRPLSLLVIIITLLLERARRSWWVAWAITWLLIDPFSLFERFVILITSWHRDYLPSGWTFFRPWYFSIVPVCLMISPLIMLWVQHRPIGVRTTKMD